MSNVGVLSMSKLETKDKLDSLKRSKLAELAISKLDILAMSKLSLPHPNPETDSKAFKRPLKNPHPEFSGTRSRVVKVLLSHLYPPSILGDMCTKKWQKKSEFSYILFDIDLQNFG